MEVLVWLCEKLDCHRQEIGIGWLKDKKAITSQWRSFSPSLVTQWWFDTIIALLWEHMRVKEQRMSDRWMTIASHDANDFVIRIRIGRYYFSHEQKERMEQNKKKIEESGFPHCFWQQRFGKWNKNYKKAREMLADWSWPLSGQRFLFESVSSLHFNDYAMQRREAKEQLLSWDIVVNAYNHKDVEVGEYRDGKIFLCYKTKPLTYTWEVRQYDTSRIATWLLLGKEPLLIQDWDALERERMWLENLWFDYEKLPAQWRRRPLWIFLEKMDLTWDDEGIVLSVRLPVWAYVTVLLHFLLQWIEEQSIIGNRLGIYSS